MNGSARYRALSIVFAALAMSLACGSDRAPARSVAGSFDFEVERAAATPTPQGGALSLPGGLQAEIGKSEAQKIAEDILTRSSIPGVGDDLIPGDAFLASPEDLEVLAAATGLQLRRAIDSSALFWIVNVAELGPRSVPVSHHGAVVNATTGEVTNIFYNRASPVSPVITVESRQLVRETAAGIRSALESAALSQLGQRFPHVLDAGFEIRSEFPVIAGGQAIIDAIIERGLATNVQAIEPANDYWLVNLVASGTPLLQSIVEGVPIFGSEYYFAIVKVDGLDPVAIGDAGTGILLPGVRTVQAPRIAEPTVAGKPTPTAAPAEAPAPVTVAPRPPGTISAERAVELAEQRLLGEIFSLIGDADRPHDLFFADRDYFVSLRQSGRLAFSPNALGPASNYFWVVNYLDQRWTPDAPRFTGVVVDAEEGIVIVTFLAIGEAIPPPPPAG